MLGGVEAEAGDTPADQFVEVLLGDGGAHTLLAVSQVAQLVQSANANFSRVLVILDGGKDNVTFSTD